MPSDEISGESLRKWVNSAVDAVYANHPLCATLTHAYKRLPWHVRLRGHLRRFCEKWGGIGKIGPHWARLYVWCHTYQEDRNNLRRLAIYRPFVAADIGFYLTIWRFRMRWGVESDGRIEAFVRWDDAEG